MGLHSNYPAFIVEIKNTRDNIEYTILTVKSFEEKLKWILNIIYKMYKSKKMNMLLTRYQWLVFCKVALVEY